MTLVLALGNCDQVIQVSDRQLTDAEGNPCVLPENKATILNLADSRLLVGFAGLARANGFRTGKWILDTLIEAAKPDHQALGTIERFTESATARFLKPDLLAVPEQNRGLSVMFTGFNDTRQSPTLIAALVTNFQNFQSGRDERPWDRFNATYWSIKEGTPREETSYIQRIGAWTAMNDPHDADKLRRLLEEYRPAAAIVDAAVGTVRSIAARRAADSRIGRDISSVVLPVSRPPELAAGTLPIQLGFHPIGTSHTVYGANQVLSLPDVQLALMEPKLAIADKTGSPMLVQKVGRNKLCPCGSGKKYKKCHGN